MREGREKGQELTFAAILGGKVPEASAVCSTGLERHIIVRGVEIIDETRIDVINAADVCIAANDWDDCCWAGGCGCGRWRRIRWDGNLWFRTCRELIDVDRINSLVTV